MSTNSCGICIWTITSCWSVRDESLTTNIQLPSYVPVLMNELPCPALQLPCSWDYDFAPQYTYTEWTLNSWAPHHWQGLVQLLPGYSFQAVSGCHLPVGVFWGPTHLFNIFSRFIIPKEAASPHH